MRENMDANTEDCVSLRFKGFACLKMNIKMLVDMSL